MNPESLRSIPLMQCFQDKELSEIIRMGEFKDVPGFTNVVIEGELSWGIYLIMAGEVEVTRSNQLDGVSYHIAHLREGNFFGELSLIDQNPRSATVRTTRDTRLFSVDKTQFEQFLNQSQERKVRFLEHTLGFIVGRLREVDDHFIVAQYQLWSRALKGKEGRVA